MGENKLMEDKLKTPEVVITKLRGSSLPRLLIVKRKIGKGGYSTVVSARPIGGAEEVAIKFTKYDPNPNGTPRLEYDDPPSLLSLDYVENENDILKSVQHDYIITWLGSQMFKSKNLFCLVTELGKMDLWKFFHGDKPRVEDYEDLELFDRNEDVVIHFLAPILDALVYLHEKNIVHFDVKVTNVIIDIKTGGVVPKLADFGSAIKLPDGCDVKFMKQYHGSPYSTPYEVVVDGMVSKKADVWAFGLSLLVLMGKSMTTGFRIETWPMLELHYSELFKYANSVTQKTDCELAGILNSWDYETDSRLMDPANFSGFHLLLIRALCLRYVDRASAQEIAQLSVVKRVLDMWIGKAERDSFFCDLQDQAMQCIQSGRTLYEVRSSSY